MYITSLFWQSQTEKPKKNLWSCIHQHHPWSLEVLSLRTDLYPLSVHTTLGVCILAVEPGPVRHLPRAKMPFTASPRSQIGGRDPSKLAFAPLWQKGNKEELIRF
jgi:hypothetical protein